MKYKIITVFVLLLIMTFLPGPKTNNMVWMPVIFCGYIGISTLDRIRKVCYNSIRGKNK